jgi:uncharacterized protein YndB with AHSA1/START domain
MEQPHAREANWRSAGKAPGVHGTCIPKLVPKNRIVYSWLDVDDLEAGRIERTSMRQRFAGMRKLLAVALLRAACLTEARADDTFANGGGRITVLIENSLAARRADILDWAQRAATAATTFYGHFPVPVLRLEVGSRLGEPVNSGREYDGRLIRIHLDPSATSADLKHDWTLTHEMFHLGFPRVNREYHYLEEGLSDYLEPLARARVKQAPATQPWKDFIEGMPRGLPKTGDAGLDGTHDWGRIYWGGCIFWLLVDLDIRQRTANTRSLDDAIRAIVAAGGTGGADWPLGKVMQIGDAATGTDSIVKVHARLGSLPVDPHLNDIWRELGVSETNGAVIFDDGAPLAGTRRAMTKLTPFDDPAGQAGP